MDFDVPIALHEDSQGNLWIGSQERGPYRIDRTGVTVTHYTTRYGLPSNSIMGILEDAAGNLWISTQRGLCLAEEEPIYFQLLGDLPFQDAIYVEEGEFCLK